jgi:hypothetical protein
MVTAVAGKEYPAKSRMVWIKSCHVITDFRGIAALFGFEEDFSAARKLSRPIVKKAFSTAKRAALVRGHQDSDDLDSDNFPDPRGRRISSIFLRARASRDMTVPIGISSKAPISL